VDLIKELGTYLKHMAPEAIIRSGDYPRGRGSLGISVILSELSSIAKVRDYFTQTVSLISTIEKRQEETERGSTVDNTSKDIPSLL
jgi:hypothetical protein